MAIKFDSTIQLGSVIKVAMGIVAAAVLYGHQEEKLSNLENVSMSQTRAVEKLTDGFNAISVTEARLSAIVESDHELIGPMMERQSSPNRRSNFGGETK